MSTTINTERNVRPIPDWLWHEVHMALGDRIAHILTRPAGHEIDYSDPNQFWLLRLADAENALFDWEHMHPSHTHCSRCPKDNAPNAVPV